MQRVSDGPLLQAFVMAEIVAAVHGHAAKDVEEVANFRAALSEAGERREIARGEPLFRQTDPPRGLWRVLRGAVEVVVGTAGAEVAERPDLCPAFYRLARLNLLTLLEARVELAALPSDDRLARRLLAQADDDGVVRASQSELADFLALTRVSGQRLLEALGDAGAIESRYRRVVVRDREALRRIAEGDAA